MILFNTKFPINQTRKNVGLNQTSFVLGDVNYRSAVKRGPSRYNKKFHELHQELKKMMNEFDPSFEYTTIQVNKNVNSLPHIDKNNVGLSYIIGLGDYQDGLLVIEGISHCIKNKFLKFDGRLGHWTTPFIGDRYSIVFFTHTFKPPHPSLRYIEVKTDGLYNKGILIKKY